jgi:hypothetical protein
MIPLWRLRSGRFAGWKADDDQFYNAEGKHIGYLIGEIAYTNDGCAVGEVYGDQWIGRSKTVIYPTGRQQAELSSKAAARLADRAGLPLAGWADPDL